MGVDRATGKMFTVGVVGKNNYLDKARQANVELGLKLGRGE